MRYIVCTGLVQIYYRCYMFYIAADIHVVCIDIHRLCRGDYRLYTRA